MSKVFIVDAKRSPIGKFLGSLSKLTPAELSSQLITRILQDLDLDPRSIDEVILGNVLSAGHGQNIARQASVLSKIPYEVPAYTLNMVCGSGMKSIINAYNSIKLQQNNLVIAGGVEVMSQASFIVDGNIRFGNKMGNIQMKDSIIVDGLTDYFNNYHMGITAENIAEKYDISREEQDLYAINSQNKAIYSIDNNKFLDEIIPIKINDDDFIYSDEYPNRNTSIEKLSKLKPAFKKDGTVTAGNSSGINDGASIMLLSSEQAIKKYNLSPIAEIIEFGQAGLDPSIMGMGPVYAIENVLSKVNINFKEIDLIELNEAFSVQSIGVLKELKKKYELDNNWIEKRVNVNGGAISLGHPLGASGSRIVTTLVYEMKRTNKKYGLASLCIGGGMGISLIVKSMNYKGE